MPSEGRLRKARNAALILLAIVGLMAFAIAMTRANVGLHGPHTKRVSSASLEPALAAAIEVKLGELKMRSVDEALEFALRQTRTRLRFGLGHPTRLEFGPAEREANCIEYAHFFARVFDMAAQKNKLHAKAYVVHSSRADVFNMVIPLPGLRDHDWVLIADDTPGDKRHWLVDPTFDDVWLGWDLTKNVDGDVKTIP